MIPRIDNLPEVSILYREYLTELKKLGFTGDIEEEHSSRLLCATDNSVYQCMPQAVIFPRSCNDIALAMKLRCHSDYKSVIFTPRGGGTGTNGQSLNRGISVDCSRYLKEVRNFNIEKREITVQSGVIKDELNELIKKDGLFFSPELSTSSRATIGGMVSNDAAGQGSLKYGRTSTHIKAVTVVLSDGSIATFGPVNGSELDEKMKLPGLEGELYRTLVPLLKTNSSKICEVFPKLNRFMTGYDLYHAYDVTTGTVNLSRLICGAEGTLGILCEAVLDLTPLPKYRSLLVVKYDNFFSALKNAIPLIDAGALSVETVDSKVLKLAMQDNIWLSVQEYIKEIPGKEIAGLNIVEFAGDDVLKEQEKLENLYKDLFSCAQREQDGILGVQKVLSVQGIAAVYGMRKKAVGLLGNAAGRRKLVAFTEDTVVPPKHLADYIREFRALLDSKGVPYGMFGHVDTGLMHVRPALDLTTDEDRRKLIEISEGVVKLVAKYQGQMWGEHGRGYRSVFGEYFFKELYPLARKVKEIFDPDNILNPGKICVPFSNDQDKLVAIDGPMRGDIDRTIPQNIRESFKGAVSCNGNGQCFSYSKSALMCPSYRYTRDHVRSPKGYAELMREWLRLVNDKGFSPSAEEASALTSIPNPVHFFYRLYNTFCDKNGDYNTEIMQKIRTCLACKSCKGVCPAHVNAADLNSRFISMYYDRYLRPSMDLLTLNAEWLIPLSAAFPKLSNAVFKNSLFKKVCAKVFGLTDLPPFSEKSLKEQCRQNGFKLLSSKQAESESPEILIVTDPFTAAYETEGLINFAKLIANLGYKVQFLRPYINGKLMVIRGARKKFVHFASKQAARLAALAQKGITLVGYDPALTICYRDEYPAILGNTRGEFEVLLPEEWLSQAVNDPKTDKILQALRKDLTSGFDDPYYLFAHCTEQALLPKSVRQWQEIMQAFGLELLPVPVACCGMAGLHGHMVQNLEESYAVYNRNWHVEISSRPFERCLVTGYSCRSQVERMEGKKAKHPVEILERLFE